MKCVFGDHDVDPLDYTTQTGPDGQEFSYCTSHEPLSKTRLRKLKTWAKPWALTPKEAP